MKNKDRSYIIDNKMIGKNILWKGYKSRGYEWKVSENISFVKEALNEIRKCYKLSRTDRKLDRKDKRYGGKIFQYNL